MHICRFLKTFDEIKATLESALEKAMVNHEREVLNPHHTGAALATALEHCNRFTLHGVIPEHISDEEP